MQKKQQQRTQTHESVKMTLTRLNKVIYTWKKLKTNKR